MKRQTNNIIVEGDISTIQNVHERAARIPNSLRRLKDYEARFDFWNLIKLADSRIRSDLIHMYKTLKNLEDISFITNYRESFSKNPYEKRMQEIV